MRIIWWRPAPGGRLTLDEVRDPMFPTTLILASLGAALSQDPRIDLRYDDSQAEAVLAIVEKRRDGTPIDDADWRRLFESEPQRRLARREADMRRAFTEEEFRAFVLSDDLAQRADSLRTALAAWRTRDLGASARRVLRYLPDNARIRSAVYPVIKPRGNSFVYDVRENPAIFLYVDPARSAAAFENTVAHELHHIGFASVSGSSDSLAAALPERARLAADWMSAFGEGFAMLAAAGGIDVHPHLASAAADRERWDRESADVAASLDAVEAFFLDLIDGRLTEPDSVNARGFSFFGVQGPWYTLGYRMAVEVERRFGREALVAAMLDPRQVLGLYNRAVAAGGRETRGLPRWSPRLLDAVGVRE